MIQRIVAVLRKNPVARKIYGIFARKQKDKLFSIPQIKPITVRKSRFDFERINLLLPSINKEHFFGGAYTALKLFDEMTQKVDGDCRVRLIITDAMPDSEALKKFDAYRLSASTEDNDEKRQLIFLNNCKKQRVYVTPKDKFVASAWWTAYRAQRIIEQQMALYGRASRYKMAYIIQDFEPSFYNWSSHFALAESTYRSQIHTISVFNSSLLKDYFKERNYGFLKDFYFEPRLNEGLKQCIDPTRNQRKKQIIVYGRPSVDRNCFPLIVEALREWVFIQPDLGDWHVISVGERHSPVELGNGITLSSLGKLSLTAYAQLLSESAIGVSLMVSPHPSYPPLEMSHAGLLTLTNTYANKNLSKLHENVVSLSELSPTTIATALVKLTATYIADPTIGLSGKSFMSYYTDNSPQFPFSGELVAMLMD